MESKNQLFNSFTGMNRDLGASKRSEKIAYEINNMRCTFNGEAKLLEWTNEKGTSKIKVTNTQSVSVTYTKDSVQKTKTIYTNRFTGNVLACSQIEDKLIVFTDRGENYIGTYELKNKDEIINPCAPHYRTFNSGVYCLTLNSDGTFNSKTLAVGNFGFNKDYKAWETLVDYENSGLQKIYWIDGINQPRYININTDLIVNDSIKLDFVPADLDSFKLTIDKEYTGGIFTAGTIQYAANYYNKSGAQTNIVYTSPIQYINNPNVGSEVDKEVACLFKLHFNNLNTNYDHLRVYAIHRAAKDQTPTVRIVSDLEIDPTHLEETGYYTTTYEDVEDTTKTITNYKLGEINYPSYYVDTALKFQVGYAPNLAISNFYIIVPQEGDVDYKCSILNYMSISSNRTSKNTVVLTIPVNGVLVTPYYIYKGIKYYDSSNIENNYVNFTVTLSAECTSISSLTEESTITQIEMTPSEVESTSDENGYIKGLAVHELIPSDITITTSHPYTTVATNTPIKKPYIDVTDLGNSGESIDYTSLIALNRDVIIPSTMDAKDGTLFFGNYKYETQNDLKLKEALKSITAANIITFYTTELTRENIDRIYPYTSQISNTPSSILGFKGGEAYYFGLIFQDYNDKWSSVIYIGKKENTIYPSQNIVSDSSVTTIVKAKVSDTAISNIFGLVSKVGKYKAMKILFVEKDDTQRNVICQGVVNSTVFAMEERINGTAPFAQASWFFRPIQNYNSILNSGSVHKPYLEWRHYMALHGEIQNENKYFVSQNEDDFGTETFTEHTVGYRNDLASAIENDASDDTIKATLGMTEGDAAINKFNFGVDEQILTLNSPDIEFNEAVQNYLHNNPSYKFRIVGYTKIMQTYADYNIELSSSSYTDNEGIHTVATGLNKPSNSLNNPIGASGFSANLSAALQDDGKTLHSTDISYYKVFPWNRSSSIDSQEKATTNNGWHCPVKTKVISNLRFCGKTLYCGYWKSNISNTYIWKNTSKIINLQNPTSPFSNAITYYGNVDTVLTNTIGYLLNDYTDAGKSKEVTEYCKDAIRMKYKSTPHAVFSLPYIGADSVILPKMKGDSDIPYEAKDIIWQDELVAADLTDRVVNVINMDNYKDCDSIADACKKYAFNNSNADVSYITLNQSNPTLGTNTETGYHTDEREAYFLVITKALGSMKYEAKLVQWSYAWNYDRLRYNVAGVVWHKTYTNKKYNKVTNLDFTSYKLIQFMSSTENRPFYIPLNDSIVMYKNTGASASITIDSCYSQDVYPSESSGFASENGTLYIAELYQDNDLLVDDFNLSQYSWQEASDTIKSDSSTTILFGDTYFQRYDCLKTYPSSNEDVNQLVEIASFMCETRINLDGRYDYNRGLTDNTNCTPDNFNLINKAYSQIQHSNQSYVNIPNEATEYPNSIVWSLTKSSAAEIDTWTSITSSSTLDLDGKKGKLNKLKTYKNLLLFFQDYGMGYIKYNENVALASSSSMPIELANSGKVSGYSYLSDTIGCTNKKSIIVTPSTLYFLNAKNKEICKLGEGGPQSISTNVIGSWLDDQDFSNENSFYDDLTKDVYFTFLGSKKALTYNEALNGFSSFYDYTMRDLQVFSNVSYVLRNKYMYSLHTGDYNRFFTTWKNNGIVKYNSLKPYGVSIVCTGDGIGDKIFNTAEFRADSFDKDDLLMNSTFDTLKAWNEYQTGTTNLSIASSLPSRLQHKYRIWRANIPRDENTTRVNNRMRNPWLFVSLMKNNPDLERTVLHDINIYYFE